MSVVEAASQATETTAEYVSLIEEVFVVNAAGYRKYVGQIWLFALVVAFVLSTTFFVEAQEMPENSAHAAEIVFSLDSTDQEDELDDEVSNFIEPIEEPIFSQTGKASYYGSKFHGRKTASGERFNKHNYTAAHRSLPFNSLVKVTNPNNNKSVLVRINDRGPFVKGRIIDLSRNAADEIGVSLGKVVVEKFVPLPSEMEEGTIYAFDENLEPLKIAGTLFTLSRSDSMTEMLRLWEELRDELSFKTFLTVSSRQISEKKYEYVFSVATLDSQGRDIEVAMAE